MSAENIKGNMCMCTHTCACTDGMEYISEQLWNCLNIIFMVQIFLECLISCLVVQGIHIFWNLKAHHCVQRPTSIIYFDSFQSSSYLHSECL
jgi:hypothetical protein